MSYEMWTFLYPAIAFGLIVLALFLGAWGDVTRNYPAATTGWFGRSIPAGTHVWGIGILLELSALLLGGIGIALILLAVVNLAQVSRLQHWVRSPAMATSQPVTEFKVDESGEATWQITNPHNVLWIVITPRYSDKTESQSIILPGWEHKVNENSWSFELGPNIDSLSIWYATDSGPSNIHRYKKSPPKQ